MKFKIVALCLMCFGETQGQLLMQLPGIKGDSQLSGYENWIHLDHLQLGVTRPPAGAQGGIQDINIGVGILEEVFISKQTDGSTADLFQLAFNGSSPGLAEIHQLTRVDSNRAVPTMILKLDRAFVASMNLGVDGFQSDEEISLRYTKVALGLASLDAKGKPSAPRVASWDRVTNTPWAGHGINAGEFSIVNAVPALNCDLTFDNQCDLADVDLFSLRPIDLSGDGQVDEKDLDVLLADTAQEQGFSTPFLRGDADLNGAVEFSDFLVFSSQFGKEGSWSDGDFSLDGTIDFGDFLMLSSNFGESSDSAHSAPESSTFSWLAPCLIGAMAFRKRTRYLS